METEQPAYGAEVNLSLLLTFILMAEIETDNTIMIVYLPQTSKSDANWHFYAILKFNVKQSIYVSFINTISCLVIGL